MKIKSENYSRLCVLSQRYADNKYNHDTYAEINNYNNEILPYNFEFWIKAIQSILSRVRKRYIVGVFELSYWTSISQA